MVPAPIYAQLERDESRRHVGYVDSQGHWTVGIGHKLSTPLTNTVIDMILRDDVAAKAAELEAKAPWVRTLSEPRYGVLLNMAFNLGVTGLLGFRRMLAAMQSADWEGAAAELLDSVYATQVGARAIRLARQLQDDRFV